MRIRFNCGGWLVCTVCFALSVRAAEVDSRTPPKTGENGVFRRILSIGQMRLPGEYERGHSTITGAFREATSNSSRSTVRVLSDGMQAALGVVVGSDGLILTKASELDGALECIFADNSRTPAQKIAQRNECDLALLKVPKHDLREIHWGEAHVPPVGSWLITANLDPQPVAIGVVSTPLQGSPTPRAVLGVRMYRVDRGVRVNVVLPGTGAARAGVREGDVIATINGRPADSTETITDLIRSLQPGDKVTLSVWREQEPLSLIATLGDMTRRGGLDQTELMDSLGGPLSKRRAGFPSIIQHDSVIRPRECGGPIVDLDGNVVGINIARASRVASFALPAELARQAAREMVNETAHLAAVNEPAAPGATTPASSPAR